MYAIYVGCQDSSKTLQSAAKPQFFSLQIVFRWQLHVHVVEQKKNNYPAQSCGISSDFSQVGIRVASSTKYQAIFCAISQDYC